MWKILLAEFIGDMKAQRTRSLLTMFATMWGTIAIVLLLAFGEGLRRSVSSGLLNAGEKIFMIWGGSTTKEWEGLPSGRRIRLSEDDLALLQRSIDEVDRVSPSYGRWGTTLAYGDVKTTTHMEGVYPAFSELRKMFPRPGGRFISERDLDERRRVLFLGDSIAYRLFGAEDPVGRTVELDGAPFVVIGVMRSKFQDSNNNGPDEDRAIIPASTFTAIYGNRYVNHLLVQPRTVGRAPETKRRIAEVLGARFKFDPTDERAIPMWDFFESEKETAMVGYGIQIFLGLVGLFTLLVAGVGVANIMYVVVRERTMEIGVKLAVGARKRHIRQQFVFEALAISLIGGLAGLLLASGIVVVVDWIPFDNPALQYIANPKLSWPIGIACVSILAGIGLAAGYLPARRAAGLDPVESLRYE
ncbi:MAG TPA: ABC transporter permease [Gemmatimonadota bacterium]|nr:ABC transporter permease [Gemmatimonadota bacterium]